MMKAVYETPNVNFEAFEVNNSIAAGCTGIDKDGKVTFSCMRGPNTDTESVVNTEYLVKCYTQAGYEDMWYNEAAQTKYAGIMNFNTNTDKDGNLSYSSYDTDYFDLSTDDVNDDGTTDLIYSFTDKALDTLAGFLYYCTNFSSSHWSAVQYKASETEEAKWYWAHTDTSHKDSHGSQSHIQFAPVWSTNINS